MLSRIKLEEGWTTLFLVWGLLATATAALIAADLTPGLEILLGISTIAILTGLLLAKSRFSDGTAHLYAFIYGVTLIVIVMGQALPGDLTWRERTVELMTRVFTWFNKAFNGGTSRDGLMFVLHTSAIFWLLGYTAAWYTFRRPRVWRAILPTGIVLLSVIYYYYGPKPLGIYLAIYALLSLIYVGRTHLIDQERIWRSAAVRYERGGVRFGFMRASFLVGIAALLVAWSLPTMTASAAVGDALSGVSQPWREFQDDWTRLFSSLRSYGTGTNDPYADTLVLGGPRNVGNNPVMDVYVTERLPYVYWQAKALDTYDGSGGWSIASFDTELHIPDDGVLDTTFAGSRQVMTQTVVNYLPNSSSLYAAPEIVGSDRQIYVDYAPDESGGLIVHGVRSRFVLKAGDRYNMVSRISVADQSELRTASTDYPQTISDVYLQMPETITPETIALAEEITAPYDNPYDKAIAVRDWLRANIEYSDQIDAPPDNVEPVHYVLFDSPIGYCTYYATSMVMLLRSQGIPSRIVNGYAQGEFIEDANAYRVRASDAHTWVEAYFPAYGWIQFEPTAAIPVVLRPETSGTGEVDPITGNVQDDLDRDDVLPEDELDEGVDEAEIPPELNPETPAAPAGLTAEERRALIIRVVAGVAVLSVAGVLLLVANSMNKRVEASVERSYGRLGWWASQIGVLFRPIYTPYERADILISAVPEGRSPIRNLTQFYVVREFSPGRDTDDQQDTSTEWRTLRPILLRQSLRRRFRRKKKE